jgi:hypothetical protein
MYPGGASFESRSGTWQQCVYFHRNNGNSYVLSSQKRHVCEPRNPVTLNVSNHHEQQNWFLKIQCRFLLHGHNNYNIEIYLWELSYEVGRLMKLTHHRVQWRALILAILAFQYVSSVLLNSGYPYVEESNVMGCYRSILMFLIVRPEIPEVLKPWCVRISPPPACGTITLHHPWELDVSFTALV